MKNGMVTAAMLLVLITGQAQQKFTIYFDFNSSSLTNEGLKRLDSFLLAKKRAATGHTIRIDGYCDAIGTNEYNLNLSNDRVSAVKEYLLNKGILPGEIAVALGHGEQDPVNQNRTAEDRQLNRRVDISLGEVAQTSVPQKDSVSLTEKITDTATKAGTSIVLKNMNFYGGTPFLLPESSPVVDELINVMKRHPGLIIEIQGHICCVAYPDDSPYTPTGRGLSEERAKSIYAELIGSGIDPSRVSYKGFGHSMPIYPYPENSEDERIANRRVEVKIINK